MTYLLDTNIVSEAVKPGLDPRVVDWLAAIDEDRVFLSFITLAEIRRGVELLAPGRRRNRLETWLADDLPLRFESRFLPIDRKVADSWGVLVVRAQRTGRALSSMAGFVAATAAAHGLTRVTRNVADFADLGLALLNPRHLA